VTFITRTAVREVNVLAHPNERTVNPIRMDSLKAFLSALIERSSLEFPIFAGFADGDGVTWECDDSDLKCKFIRLFIVAKLKGSTMLLFRDVNGFDIVATGVEHALLVIGIVSECGAKVPLIVWVCI